MVVKVNETSVAARPMDVGVARQRLLTPERVDNIDVPLDRLTLAAGASTRFEPSAKSLPRIGQADSERFRIIPKGLACRRAGRVAATVKRLLLQTRGKGVKSHVAIKRNPFDPACQ